MKRGQCRGVAARFCDLFTKPSEVAPLLMDALSRGKQIHCADVGELASILPVLRTIAKRSPGWRPTLDVDGTSLSSRTAHRLR